MAVSKKKISIFDLKSIPVGPGTYRFFNGVGDLIYVGKAKNLRRRLSQYANSRRVKKHKKMQLILKTASRFEFEEAATELEAELSETRQIQLGKPKLNISNAFHFMYPYLGINVLPNRITVCFTTLPDDVKGFVFYGVFRSRKLTREAFDALDEIFCLLGHPETWVGERPAYSIFRSFRRLDSAWTDKLGSFFKGENRLLLEDLLLALVEKPSARSRGEELQKSLRTLRKFYNREVVPLKRAIKMFSVTEYPVSQTLRDLLFIRARGAKKNVSPELSEAAG